MNKKTRLQVMALAMGLGLSGCGQKAQVLRIAVAMPLTGDMGTEGQGVRRAVELAVAEINESKKFPFPVEARAFDDRADPKEAVNVANLIISDPQMIAVVGHYNSGCSIPASQVYSRAGLAMVSPASTNPKLTQQQLESSWNGPKSVFRVVPTDDVQGSYAAEFIYRKLKFKRFAVVHDKTPYGQGLAEQFQKRFVEIGGQVLSFDGISVGERDFKALLTRIKSLSPEGLYFGGLYTEAGLLIKQAKELGLKARFFSGDGTKTPTLFDVAGEAADGAYLTITGIPVEYLPTAKGFIQKYQKKFPGMELKPFDHFGYEATNIILETLAKILPPPPQNPLTSVPTLRAALIEKLRKTKYSGLLGLTTFDEKGDTLNKIITMTQARFKDRSFPPLQ
ncbi:MAG: branched-chain amino acid ABC transporter substrate-binding protein [Elusimicrobia bacterium]|nr:branched-chain amino acid ABC transporter substrate-binding protein [Elusimicrobiota bacterium]